MTTSATQPAVGMLTSAEQRSAARPPRAASCYALTGAGRLQRAPVRTC